MSLNEKSCKRCGTAFVRKRKYSQSQWNNARFCNRKCGAWNLGLTKEDDSRLAHIAEVRRAIATGRPGWSKGQTKETNTSLAIVSRKVSIAQRGRAPSASALVNLAKGRTWAKGRTKENCPVVAARSISIANAHRGRSNPEHSARLKALFTAHPEKHVNAILAKKTKGRGYTHIEKCVSKHLDNLGVTYAFNARIGTKWPDFSIPSHSLLIEADGEYWHRDAEKERTRDEYLKSLGWKILHLPGRLITTAPERCRSIIVETLEGCNVPR